MCNMARDLSDIIIAEEERKKRAGYEFEKDTIWALRKSHPTLENCIGTDLDKCEGTDFIHNSVRFDITLDFKNKDHMPFMIDTDIKVTQNDTMHMGVRIGNRHNGYTEFPEPVIILGLNMDSRTYKKREDEIVDNLVKQADDIIMTANDVYLDYTTTDQDERQDLFDLQLEVNKKFRKPKTISQRYDILNEQQYSVISERGEPAYA